MVEPIHEPQRPTIAQLCVQLANFGRRWRATHTLPTDALPSVQAVADNIEQKYDYTELRRTPTTDDPGEYEAGSGGGLP